MTIILFHSLVDRFPRHYIHSNNGISNNKPIQTNNKKEFFRKTISSFKQLLNIEKLSYNFGAV